MSRTRSSFAVQRTDDDFAIESMRKMERELSTEEYTRILQGLKKWATRTKVNSKSATGMGIARLIEKIAEDGRITTEDESLILGVVAAQQGWWSILILMDTLVLAIFTPLLSYEQPEDNGFFEGEQKRNLLFAYRLAVSLTYFSAFLQLFTTLLLFALSSLLFEIKSVIFLFVHCHSLLCGLNNFGMMALVPGMCIAPMLSQVLAIGFDDALPTVIIGSITFVAAIIMYAKVIKPVFVGLFNEEFQILEMETSQTFKLGSKELCIPEDNESSTSSSIYRPRS